MIFAKHRQEKLQKGKGEESKIIEPFSPLLFKVFNGIPFDKSPKLQAYAGPGFGADWLLPHSSKFLPDQNRGRSTIIGTVGETRTAVSEPFRYRQPFRKLLIAATSEWSQ
jgi:hypothetical protein